MRPIRDLLAEVAADSSGHALATHAFGGLSAAAKVALQRADHEVYTGKVRDVVGLGDELLIVHSDRLTAFDKLIAMVPYKGTILTAISAYWLQEAQKVVPTHFISSPHERVLRTRRTVPFKVEVVVRGFLAGSMQRAYAAGMREFCGAALPEGLTPYGRLPHPILTPTTKAAAFEHDENISPAALSARGIVSEAEWAEIARLALTLFAHGQRVFDKLGWILVDTKYEFGRTSNGEIIVIDEIHTPDSSRLWLKDTYEAKLRAKLSPDMLDKEVVRRWLIEHGFSGEGVVPTVPQDVLLGLARRYLDVAETLTGQPLLSTGSASIPNLLTLT